MTNMDKLEDDIFYRVERCPNCGYDTIWGNMIWLNGECLCPTCYEFKSAEYRIKQYNENRGAN